MARDGKSASGATQRRESDGIGLEEMRDRAVFGRLRSGPLNHWNVEERRG